MRIWRQLIPLISRVKSFNYINSYCDCPKRLFSVMKQIHQETLRYVHPYPRITIISDIYVKIYSADLHTYPNGNAFIAELHGGPVRNCTASMSVKVSNDDRDVEVIVTQLQQHTDFHCELAIPVRATLNINSKHGASITNTFGEELKIKSKRFINTRDVRAEHIELLCETGNISCCGLLLGKASFIETTENGHIFLDKVQGDELDCRTSIGNITTNCSYVASSKFTTDCGQLQLKNIHKSCEVNVNNNGQLHMTGVHGNLKVHAKSGLINLQLSELVGENFITLEDVTNAVINISDRIEQNTILMAEIHNSDSFIELDPTLSHLAQGLADDKRAFRWAQSMNAKHSLTIKATKPSILLGKSSWMQSFNIQFNKNLHQTNRTN